VNAVAPAAENIVDGFADRLFTIFTEDLRLTATAAKPVLGHLAAALQSEGPSSVTAAEILREEGVRDRWNSVFATDRARAVASAVSEYVQGTVADLLAGDATVAAALTDCVPGPVTCWERMGAYPDAPVLPIRDASQIAALQPTANTVLMSTVLHHENSAGSLLDTATIFGADRWIIVENCIDAHTSRGMHEFCDWFFNRTLNTFDVPVTMEHRTLAQWCSLLTGYGQVRVAKDVGRPPGMPFTYQLIVVDRT
jgi:hypothetical protein